MLSEKMINVTTGMMAASIVVGQIGIRKNNPKLCMIGAGIYFASVIPATIGIIASFKNK